MTDIDMASARGKRALTPLRLAKEATVVAAVIAAVWLVSAGLVNWDFVASVDLGAIWKYYPALLRGLMMTVVITGSAIVIATLIGTTLAIVSQSRSWIVKLLVTIYVEAFRGVPILIILFWVHFALPRLLGFSMNVITSGLLAMVIQASAYMTAVMQAGLTTVPKGQSEAAQSLGLSTYLRWRLVVLPQAIRAMLPAITNVLTSMLKASAALSALSIPQLWQVAQQIGGYTFKPLEALTIAAILYYLLGKCVTTGMRVVERRMNHTG